MKVNDRVCHNELPWVWTITKIGDDGTCEMVCPQHDGPVTVLVEDLSLEADVYPI